MRLTGRCMNVWSSCMLSRGRGSAFVRTKLKDVINGGVVERTFNPSNGFFKEGVY